MRILLIGGAGYIGSHAADLLLKNGHGIFVFDNLSSGYAENLSPNIPLIHGDISDIDALDSVFDKGFDAVMHFAALKNAGESMAMPEKYYQTNVIGIFNILNSMVKHGVKNIVFSSSAAVYGSPKYFPIDESHPLNPENFYGFTKLECEKLLEWYSKINGINYAALRYFNAAGYSAENTKMMEKNPGNLLPLIMEAASGRRAGLDVYGNTYETPDGTGVRDYIHVTDLADAHVRALDYIKYNSSNATINLSTGNGYSVMQLINACEKLTGKKIAYSIAEKRTGDPAIVVASSSLARELLGWIPYNSNVDNIILSMWEIYKK